MNGAGHVRRRGKNSWELKFDAGRDELTGKRITQFHSFKGTRKEAQNKLAELVAAVSKGEYVGKSTLTVGEHVKARIDHWVAMEKITAKTAERYHELLENQIRPILGAKALQKLKPVDIERWHAALKTGGRKDGKGGLGGRTIGHAHRLLSKALKDAVGNELVIRNVAATKSPPKVADEDAEIVILTADEVKTAVTQLRGRPLYPSAMLALFVGLRRGEILALRWRHLQIDDYQPVKVVQIEQALEETKAGVRFKKPKTKNSVRALGLPDIVIEALRDWRRLQLEHQVALGLGKLPDALVFPRLDGTPQSPRAYSKAWSDTAAAMGLPVTFHALRHTHASHLIDAGIDAVTVSKRLGHSSPTVTLQIYAHLFRKRDDRSAEAINTAVALLLDKA
jgi:integrase